MSEPLVRHPRNSDGPFYVVKDECISCGAPESHAGELMSHDDSGHCFFVRQPSTSEEVSAAIGAVWVSCCAAVRYGGTDTAILTRIGNLGELSLCDNPPSPPPPTILRDCARFEYSSPDCNSSKRSDLKQIIRFIAKSLSDSYTRNSGFRYWWSSGSFRHEWAVSVSKNSIRFHVKSEGEGRWLLRMSENELARIGMAIALDGVLRKNGLFQNIRWFSVDEASGDLAFENPHPY